MTTKPKTTKTNKVKGEKLECKGQHNFNADELSNGEVIIVCRKCGMRVDDCSRRLPLEEGKREMWAILGKSGGLYGFAPSSWKAKKIQRDYWNIGCRKPIKYLVTFKRL